MRILDRYLMRVVCSTIAVVYLVVLAINCFIWLAGEVNDIGQEQYNVWYALYFVLLQMPYQLSILFPLICLIGALVGLGMLGSSNEIVVMRVSRMSINRMLAVMAFLALCLGSLVTGFGETVGFYAKHSGEQFKDHKLGQALSQDVNKIWLKQGHDYWYVEKMLSDGALLGVIGLQFDNIGRLDSILQAPKGHLCDDSWCLQQVKSTVFEEDHTSLQQAPFTKIELNIGYGLLSTMMQNPEDISLAMLWRLTQNHDRVLGKVNKNKYALSFWQRLLQPLYALVMILLAVPIIFGPLRASNMGVRLLAGVVIGFVFYVFQNVFGPIGLLLHYPPWAAALAPALLCMMLSGWVIRKIN